MPISDPYAAHREQDATASLWDGVALTELDDDEENTLGRVTRGLWIGTGSENGNLKVKLVSGAVLQYTSVPVGFWPRAVIKVFDTGTDVSDIIAEY